MILWYKYSMVCVWRKCCQCELKSIESYTGIVQKNTIPGSHRRSNQFNTIQLQHYIYNINMYLPTTGNTDETSKTSIHRHGQIILHITSPPQIQNTIQKHGTHSRTRSTHGSIHRRQSRHIPRILIRNPQRTPSIKPIPTKPQNERSQHLKRHGVWGKGLWMVVRIPILIVKSSNARSEHNRAEEGTHPSRHVDYTRPGEINHAHTPEWIVGTCR